MHYQSNFRQKSKTAVTVTQPGIVKTKNIIYFEVANK